jgi:hypothetical protein
MKNRISFIMDTRKKRLGTIIVSIAIIATLCTGLAFAATNGSAASTNNGTPGEAAQSVDTRITFETEDGQEVEISNPQFMRPAGRFRIEADGSRTAIADEWVDGFYDRHNVPQAPSIFDRDDSEDAEFSFSIVANDGSVLAGDPAMFDIAHTLPTYTDEEWSQIIADIESGKLQPHGQINNDGTLTIFDVPNNPLLDRRTDGAVSREITLSFGGEDLTFDEEDIKFGD